jgi:hypothetical protein
MRHDDGCRAGRERARATVAEFVERPAHELFARAGFTLDEHGGVGRRHAPHDLEQLANCLAASSDSERGRLVSDLASEVVIFS